MNVGIFVFQTNTSVDSAVLAKHAEDLGFESYWVPEHAILPVHTTSRFPGSPDGAVPDAYGRIVDPFIALARASAVTQTIKLGTGICLVPEHNPPAPRQGDFLIGSGIRRTVPVRHRGGVAQGRKRDDGRRFRASLDPDARRPSWP